MFTVLEQENNDNSNKLKELDKGNENPDAVIEEMVLDNGAGERDSDGGEGGASIGASCSSFASRPPPPFLRKIYDMLANDETNSIVSWSSTGTSFVIWNHHLFAANILPIYFKHSNFQSFICQLNLYGFKKIRWEQWEFWNEYFRKGKRHLLKNIKRRNQNSNSVIQPATETQTSMDTSSCSNTDKEFKILMKENDFLKMEIIKLKERQDIIQKNVASLKNQELSNEQNHQKIIMLLAKIISWNPSNTVDEGETTQQSIKGKRKLEEKEKLAITQSNRSTMCSELGSCSSALQGQDTAATTFPELSIEQFIRQAKMSMDDEEMGYDHPNTFIPLEDLIGKSFDINWVEYMRQM